MILIVAFFLLGITALYSLKHPAVMVAAAICVFGFEQWAQVKMPFFVIHSTFLNYYVGIFTLLGVGLVALRGHNPLDPFPTGMKLVFAIYIYAFASMVWSINITQSAVIMKAFGPYIASSVFLAPLLIYRMEHFRKLLLITVIMGTIIMILLVTGTRIHDWGRTIVLEHNVKVLEKNGEYSDRLSPLAIAEMGGQVALIVMMMNFTGIQKIWSLSRWFIVFLGVFLIVRSGSRGQLLGIVLVAFTFFGASRSESKAGQALRSIVSLGILALVVFATMFVLDAFDRMNVEKMTEDYQQTRFQMSAILLKYWFTSSPMRWLFGIGGAGSWDSAIIGGYCHIQPVEVLAELGVIGFGLYLAIIYQVVRSWLNVMKIYRKDREKRGMAVALAALFAFSFILSLKQGSFIGTPTFGLFAILLFKFETLANREHAAEQAKEAYWSWYQSYYQQQQLLQPQQPQQLEPVAQ